MAGGRYWLVGDVYNTPGRSMFVRLHESPKGPAGKWTDAATGEHGDLLDIIRESLALRDFRDVAEEARRFLSCLVPRSNHSRGPFVQSRRPDRRKPLVGSLRYRNPIEGTLAEAYLRVAALRCINRWQLALPSSLLLSTG
jgi:hypothetical protein